MLYLVVFAQKLSLCPKLSVDSFILKIEHEKNPKKC